MKKTLLIAGALLALTASASFAGGINLSWTDCGATGTLLRNFACTTNSNASAHVMIGSAIANAPMPSLNGMETVIDLQTTAATLSSWWLMQTGGCRAGNILGNYDFTSGPFTCYDVWAGGASGGINYTNGFNGPNRARVRLVCAIPGSTAIDDVTETYYFKCTINNAKTTGTGSCAGCTDGACIVFNSIKLTQPPALNADQTISNPIGHNWVVYNNGFLSPTCPAPTPTHSTTWGSVKSLYR